MTDNEKETIEYFQECISKENLFEDDLTLGFMQKAVNLIQKQQRQLAIKDKYLELMYFKLFDYDGWNTVDSLKSLIDEAVDYIKKAGKCDDKYAVYQGGNGKYFNILYEEVKVETDEETNNKDTEIMLDTEKMDIQE